MSGRVTFLLIQAASTPLGHHREVWLNLAAQWMVKLYMEGIGGQT